MANFTNELSKILDWYLNQPYDLCLIGDFNINLNPEKQQTAAWHYLGTLLSFRLFPLITTPTLVTETSQTFIDRIFCNITTKVIYQSDITDHFPIFCLLYNNAPKH